MSGVLLIMSSTHFRAQNKCTVLHFCCANGEGKKMQSPSSIISSLLLDPHKSAVVLWVFIQKRGKHKRLISSSTQVRCGRSTHMYTLYTLMVGNRALTNISDFIFSLLVQRCEPINATRRTTFVFVSMLKNGA